MRVTLKPLSGASRDVAGVAPPHGVTAACPRAWPLSRWQLLESKEHLWEAAKQQVIERLDELSEAFTGKTTLSRIGRDEQLQQWFTQLAEQVRTLDSSDSNASGRKMHHLIAALSEVEQFHRACPGERDAHTRSPLGRL